MREFDERDSASPRVALIGGGLAGLAAAAVLAQEGLNVELFEQRRWLGGRAGSFRDPQDGTLVDYCPHVWMGCCTNMADFCRRTDVSGSFRRHRQMHFVGPEGQHCQFAGASWLPAPLDLLPAMAQLDFLTPGERRGIARAVFRLARSASGEGTIGAWLRGQGQSERMIQRFWSVVLVSALGETVDRASWAAARKVFCDGLLASRYARDLYVPQSPLGEIFGRVGQWLMARGAGIHCATRVRQIMGDARGATAVLLPDGSQWPLDFLVVAVPWRQVGRLFPPPLRAALPELDEAEALQSAPITCVHLWFDRPVTRLPHAVLVGRLSQWLFTAADGQYCQVVISASHALRGRRQEDIVAEVCRELESIWPAACQLALRRWRVVTQPAAVFSVTPESDRARPAQQTSLPNVFLAGDWTATGWPATMEGAVRSGYLAAEAILRAVGVSRRILVPDLPRDWLARQLVR